MSDRKKLISSKGVPLVSGLESLTSIVVYEGEFVNFGDSYEYITQLNSQSSHSTTATDFIGDVLTNQFPTNTGEYYRFKTSGSPYTNVNSPTSNYQFLFQGQKTGGLPSHSGIYQRLSGLNVGFEYKISIKSFINNSTGTLTVETYCNKGYSSTNPVFLQTSSKDISYPITGSSTCITESSFIAESTNDVLLLRFTTDETSLQTASVSTISIQEKQEFLVPTFTETSTGVAHKVLSKPSFEITDD